MTIGYFTCYFKLHNLLDLYLKLIPFTSNNFDGSGHILRAQIYIQGLVLMYLEMISLFANLAFVHDIITSVRKPFSKSKKRFKKYLVGCFVIPVFPIVCLIIYDQYDNLQESIELRNLSNYWNKHMKKNDNDSMEIECGYK